MKHATQNVLRLGECQLIKLYQTQFYYKITIHLRYLIFCDYIITCRKIGTEV